MPTPTPTLLPVLDGTWLAVTAPDETMSVGVFGPTKSEATERFLEAVTNRQRLYAASTEAP